MWAGRYLITRLVATLGSIERRSLDAKAEGGEMPRTKKHRGDEVNIVSIDLLVDQNEEQCHTEQYESEKYLVLRRGSDIQFQVEFSRPLSGDKLEVNLHRGYRTSYRRGTRFTAELGISPDSEKNYMLAIKSIKTEGVKEVYALTVPSDFPVGGYRVEIEVTPENSWNSSKLEVEKEIVVLFNPWCKDDSVHMSEEKHLDEYIMNESGLIYAGTYDDMFTWPWNFAQFDPESLDAVLYLMDMSVILDSDGRRNPTTVARAMAEMVNQEDNDGGILYGLWSDKEEDYADGTDPTAWSGSAAILKQFLDTKKPVRYAQCWVFGGTLTTVLRCVGIPARPVTNFESAHDANFNRAIDFYFDLNDEVVEEKSGDSIWNYHVWVEGWMSRPDLGPTYGGWQALDATPQEISPHSRSYVVGPASLVAIKDGQDLKYDNEFVIAEVNADIKYYYETQKGKFELSGSNISKVGKNISTKSCGGEDREDVTDKYKYPEGSVQERAALGAEGDLAKVNDVSFEIELKKKAYKIGDDVEISVKASASGRSTRTVRLSINTKAVNYIGVAKSSIRKFTTTMKVTPGTESAFSSSIPFSDYSGHLTDQALLSVTVLALVEDTNQSWVGKKTVPLQKPSITITVTKGKTKTAVGTQLKAGVGYDVTTSFINPLNKPLTNVVYFVEGAKLTPPLKKEGKSIGVGERGEVVFEMTPQRSRSGRGKAQQQRTIVVTCQSKELKGIMGTATFTVV